MSIAFHNPDMTRDQFFAWAEQDGGRWEFDGFEPIAMGGGTFNHSRIVRNLQTALHRRLRGSFCQSAGPDAGLATIGDAVRYPDALVTCAEVPGDARVVPGVVIVFEVISPSTAQTDRIIKLREYRAVPSIRRYVIVEQTSIGLTVLTRAAAAEDWTATALTAEETLQMPEIGIEIPVAEIYEDVDFPGAAEQ